MSSADKKQNFLQGTALLAMATAVVKVIGALYKIPLNAIIGKEGFGYFNTAYVIYNVLLMISTAGLPVAMSRMISHASSLGHNNQVRRIYHTARGIFLGLGIAGTLLMTFFCQPLANWMEQPNAWPAIACLGPCCLLICLMSTYRGFFQGQSNMLPTSISQILEAFTKLIVGIAAALIILKMTSSVPFAAGGAILGVTASCMVSAAYLFGRFRKSYHALEISEDKPESFKATAKGLMIIAIPITLGSAGLQILTMLESKIYMSNLLALGNTQAQADGMKGIYDMTLTIFNMPCAFITPVTISIIPAITSLIAVGKTKETKATEESAIRVTTLLVAPCAVGLCVLSQPILALLRGYSGENLMLAGNLLSILGFTVVLNSLVLLTNAIMQAHGNVVMPVVNMIVGGIIKVIVNYILVGNPAIHIQGAPIGTLCCYTAITALNILALRRTTKDAPAVIRNLFKPMLAAILMGVVTFFAWKGLALFTSSRILLCGGPIAVAVVVYVALIFILRPLTYADCMLLPKGEKIAKILRVKR